MEAAVTLPVARSTSAKTGVAPVYTTALVVAMNDSDGTTTSSPGPTPASTSARCSPVVQLETATPSAARTLAANADSNAATRGPWATHPLRNTSVTALTSASPSTGRMIGIGAVPISSTSIEAEPIEAEPIEAEPIDEGLSISVMPPPPSNARAATTPRVRPDLRRARPPPGTRDPVRRPGCRPTGGAPD